MDGKTYLYQLRNLLEEGSSSTFMDTRTSYDFLYEAACELAKVTLALTDSEDITTVADQSAYILPADFYSLYVTDDENEKVVKYSDGSATYWLKYRPIGKVKYSANTTSVTIPYNFSVTDRALASTITGTATANGSASYGQCTLTDSTQSFLTTVSPGDTVHNAGDSSIGVVLSVTSNTAVVIALFGGTNDDVSLGDAYVIVPQGRRQLILDPPPSTSAHTVTVEYVKKPNPVYSEVGRYPFDATYGSALVKYAAWLYKYRDREPDYGDKFYIYWQQSLRKNLAHEENSRDKNSWGVSFRKRSYRDRSYR
jgi:hypothetical protein